MLSSIGTSLNKKTTKVVVMVDPYSTGSVISREIVRRGYHVMALWSHDISDENRYHVPSTCKDLRYAMEVRAPAPSPNVTKKELLNESAKRLKDAANAISPDSEIVALICGGEHGVQLADELGEHMGLRGNGTSVPQRRDKKLQQELVKKAGLRSVRQAGGTNFDRDVKDFLMKESFPVVVKPVESAGSDGVKLCYTYEEAKAHFELLMSSQMRVGSAQGAAVLCQEFLKGPEYVVDHVSRDGVHKTMMVWRYDKRPANGGDFVYFGMIPVDSQSEEAKLVIPYIRGVLNALQITNGATHGEVILQKDGPCLVEMNCRAHGGNGNWRLLERGLNGGYSQVEATVDCFLDGEQFDKLPMQSPSPFKAAGQEIMMVSYSKGIVKRNLAFDIFRKLPSFLLLESDVDVGSEVEYTTDLFNCLGSVVLLHEDPEVIKRDHDFVRHAERINALFEFETTVESLKRPPRGMVDQVMLAAATGGKQHRKMPSLAEEVEGEEERSSGDEEKKESEPAGPVLIRHMSNDRPDLGRSLMKRPTTVKASEEVVIVVDPCNTGACIAMELQKRTFNVVALWSQHVTAPMKQSKPLGCDNLRYMAELNQDGYQSMDHMIEWIQTAAKTKNYRIVACLCGAESGIELADTISEKLGLRTNGTSLKTVRRDKQLQQEKIQKSGLRSIKQVGGSSRSQGTDVYEFLVDEMNYPMVIKPRASHWVAGGNASGDAVKLCHTIDEACGHFDLLMKTQTMFGIPNAAVLCQEFLRGKEYVVDQVSRDGVHKTTMLWSYDKRSANGSNSVYVGLVPVNPSESQDAKLVLDYANKCLDAMGYNNGPSHAEIIMDGDGPVLVELNCRAHGGDGIWMPLARALTGGYTQVDVTVDAYLDKARFGALPDVPNTPFKAYGQELMLVSFSRGKVEGTPGFDAIKDLPSYVYLETSIQSGSEVDYTTDLFSNVGSVILMHRDEEQVSKDIAYIRNLEKTNQLFDYQHVPHYLKGNTLGGTTSSSTAVVKEDTAQKDTISTMPPIPTMKPSTAGTPQHVRKPSSSGKHKRVISSDRPDIFW